MSVAAPALPVFDAPYAEDDAAVARRLLAEAPLPPERERRIDERRDAPDRGDPRTAGRARRRRGHAARVRALHQGGPRPHGAGRGAAARTGRRHRRPADRGQARPGGLRPPCRDVGRFSGHRLRLGAWRLGADHPAGRDARGHLGNARQAPRRAGLARRRPSGHARHGQPFRARPDDRGRARAAPTPALGGSTATPSTCWAKARARPRTRRATSTPTPDAIEAIGRSAGNAPLPDRPGISVKLSALHPRYEAVSRGRVMRELVPRVVELAAAAKAYDLEFHRRRRGGGPPRTVARRDRRRARRSVARRLGRLRARGPGLPEARAAR